MALRLAFLLLAALTGCDDARSAADALELHCRGVQIVADQPEISAAKIYRIDLTSFRLAVWNPDVRRFSNWGTGRALVSPAKVQYTGEVRLLELPVLINRRIVYDRASKKIRDQVDASWGTVMEFNGACEERLTAT